MRDRENARNPYRAPSAATTSSAIREVPWLPWLVAGGGPLGLVLALEVGGVPYDDGLLVMLAPGLALVALGVILRRRRRTLVVDGSSVRVVRGGTPGAAFEASAIGKRDHHPGITAAYFFLMAAVVSSSCKAYAAHGHASLVERVTMVWTGLFVGAMCCVAIWRRLVCVRVVVPGERWALWIHEDNASTLRQPAVR